MGIRKLSTYGENKRWEVYFGRVDGKRKRAYFKTKAEAEEALGLFEAERRRLGDVWAQLSPEKRASAAKIIEKAEAAGTTIEEVWEFWKSSQAKRAGKTLGEVYTVFLDARSGAGLSERYLTELRTYLRKFILDREDLDVSEVTPAIIDEWFADRKESPRTRQSGLNRLSALFEFCIRRGYLPENPVKRVERVRVPPVKREILTVEQCRRLLVAAHKIDRGLLTYLGLALFCGIRPDEAKRITKKEIDLERGVVTLDARKSKVRNWRFITLTEPAKHCIRGGKKFQATNFRRRFDALRAEAGIENWPHDVLRKTAASHFYNIYGIDKATEQLGHSGAVMLRVYRNLVSEADTKEWLAITPLELAVVDEGKLA